MQYNKIKCQDLKLCLSKFNYVINTKKLFTEFLNLYNQYTKNLDRMNNINSEIENKKDIMRQKIKNIQNKEQKKKKIKSDLRLQIYLKKRRSDIENINKSITNQIEKMLKKIQKNLIKLGMRSLYSIKLYNFWYSMKNNINKNLDKAIEYYRTKIKIMNGSIIGDEENSCQTKCKYNNNCDKALSLIGCGSKKCLDENKEIKKCEIKEQNEIVNNITNINLQNHMISEMLEKEEQGIQKEMKKPNKISDILSQSLNDFDEDELEYKLRELELEELNKKIN